MTGLAEMAMHRAEGDAVLYPLSDGGHAALADLARTVEQVTRGCGHPGQAPGAARKGLALKDLRRLVRLVEDVAAAEGFSLDGLRAPESAPERFAGNAVASRCFLDAASDPDEQLPRRFTATLREKPINGRLHVTTEVNGVIVGDRLSDRIHGHPGSRYHDVFHFGHVAVLGWSPVVRNMFGRKRVSKPAKLELEDCTRAQVIEEAIVSAVFAHARRHDFRLEGQPIPPMLIDTIRDLTRGYEIEGCPEEDWEEAIRVGAVAYRALAERRGGTVFVDMHARTMRVSGA